MTAFDIRESISAVAFPSMTSGVWRTVSTEFCKDANSPLTNVFPNVLMEAGSHSASLRECSGWVGIEVTE